MLEFIPYLARAEPATQPTYVMMSHHMHHLSEDDTFDITYQATAVGGSAN